jgi:DNA-binding beta-propeller fold protein YncE
MKIALGRGCGAAPAILLLLNLAACVSPAGGPSSLGRIGDAPIGPASQRLDYASLDQKAGLLFVADLAGGHVLVFDVRQGRLVKSIDGLPRVHGVLAVPELGKVFASATGRDELDAIDERSLSVTAATPAGHYPDGIAWAPNAGRLFVSDEHGDSVAVIDPTTTRLTELIPIGGDVGNTQFDGGSSLVLTTDQTHNELITIDPHADRIVSRDKLTACKGAHGLLIETSRRLAFVACEDNATLVVFSLAEHRQLHTMQVAADPDVLAYDPALARLYVASESGVVSIFRVEAEQLVKLDQARLADNAHVVAVDPGSHRVFFPLRDINGQSVIRVMEPK